MGTLNVNGGNCQDIKVKPLDFSGNMCYNICRIRERKGEAEMTYGIGRVPADVDPIEERLAEIEAMELTGTTYKRPSDYLVCKTCGQSGRKGSYPFSTCPGSGYCDDCFG